MERVTALYYRLSIDDDNRDKSNSIKNQRDLLRQFIADDPALSSGEVLEFSDDGWSGTNFDRPQVQKLLGLARRGGVQCIVVKDLSRWGRNYIEVNEYIEQIFPFLGIRFISLNDRYDSDDYKGATAPVDVAFTALVHDLYCRDLSQKVRQSYMVKAKNGEFIHGAAPYGFVKSAADKKIEIDEEAAAVVRRIFSLACDGMKALKIAALLNMEKVDSPVMYQRRLGRKAVGYQSMKSKNGVWTEYTIRRIISDERYTGVLVCGRTRTRDVGGKKRVYLPESEWIKVPGTHEAIVSADVYKKANAGIKHYRKSGVRGSRVPFIGKLKCGFCGHALRYNPTKTPYFVCQGPAMNFGMGCDDGRVYVSDLNDAILCTVKTEAAKALGMREKQDVAPERDSSGKNEALTEQKRLNARIGLLEHRSVSLYEDYVDGKLDKDGYLAAKDVCAAELANAEGRAAELAARIKTAADIPAISDDAPFLRRILDAEDVTGEVLSLVDCITVYDPERIEIRFAVGDMLKEAIQ